MWTLLLQIVYVVAGLMVVIHAFIQLDLLRAVRRTPRHPPVTPIDDTSAPFVLVQLPVYNEPTVVVRLLEAVSGQDYPVDRWRIQVLDDSTDCTPELVAAWIIRSSAPVAVDHLRRDHRLGFKAGALDEGLTQAFRQGLTPDLVAILDADFMPDAGFLRRAAGGFRETDVGVVQGRWGHDNAEESWLTRSQAMMLDAHFSVEQAGRQSIGCFRAFNGSAGLIRVAALESAGGWRPTTITEDLDLSIRLQLQGWRIRFDETLVVPAELPAEVGALRVQQHRWMRGVAQNARTHLMSARTVRGRTRSHLTWQLLESGTFVAMAACLLLAGPMTLAVGRGTAHRLVAANLPLLCGFLAMAPVYFHASINRVPGVAARLWHYAQFVSFSAAQTLPNAVAVCAGWLAGAGEFERTQKSGDGPIVRTRFRIRARTVIESVLAAVVVAGSGFALAMFPSQALFLWPVAGWVLGSACLLFSILRRRVVGTRPAPPIDSD